MFFIIGISIYLCLLNDNINHIDYYDINHTYTQIIFQIICIFIIFFLKMTLIGAILKKVQSLDNIKDANKYTSPPPELEETVLCTKRKIRKYKVIMSLFLMIFSLEIPLFRH